MPISHGTRRLTIAHQVSCYLADVCLFRIVFAPCQVFISQVGPFFIKVPLWQKRKDKLEDTGNPTSPKAQMHHMPNVTFEKWCRVWWVVRQSADKCWNTNPRWFYSNRCSPPGVQVAISSAGNRSVPARQYGHTPFGAPLCSPRFAVVL